MITFFRRRKYRIEYERKELLLIIKELSSVIPDRSNLVKDDTLFKDIHTGLRYLKRQVRKTNDLKTLKELRTFISSYKVMLEPYIKDYRLPLSNDEEHA